ncbi:MAG TPA: hypothetical protein VFH87_07740, partial [Candidatus Udaeobacter sp.]|nr:hypothetical protein [Candidatus Udaeobacter sp.]
YREEGCMELPFADAACAPFFRAAFAVMAVFARSAGIASCAGRCFRQARKDEGGYYGDDERYRFHGFSIVFRRGRLDPVCQRVVLVLVQAY